MNAFADREILDLFKEQPDLLAVADAVASTQPRLRVRRGRRRVVRFALVPAVAAVAAVALLVVAAPWQHAQPSIDSRVFFQRALAVIGDRPVLHVALRYSSTEDNVVDLATGDKRTRVYHGEVWTDAKRGVTRSRFSIDDSAAHDVVSHDGRVGLFDPAFADFATQYRNALESGRARIVGRTDVAGRPAVRIQFASANPDYSEVMTVDAATFVPRTLEYTGPNGSTLVQISRMESLPYRDSLFESASPSAQEPQLTVGQGGEITLAEAARILGRPVLGFSGRKPTSIERYTVSGTSPTGADVSDEYVLLHYGDDTITLASGKWAVASLGFGAAGGTPPEGSVEIFGGPGGGIGWLTRDGVAVSLDVQHGDVLSAARSLEPIG